MEPHMSLYIAQYRYIVLSLAIYCLMWAINGIFSMQPSKLALADQQTQPMSTQRGPRSRALGALRWLLPLLLCLFFLAAALLAQPVLRKDVRTLAHHILPRLHPHLLHPQAAITSALPANSIAPSFMNAMLHKTWPAMWSMLHPDAQAVWQNEQDFVHFEQAKFGSLQLLTYKASAARTQHSWRDPDTTYTYPVAETLTISLQATAPKGLLSVPSNTALQYGLFNTTLFAVAPYKSTWRVLIAGPADLEAAILVPATAPAKKLLVPIFMYHHVSDLPTYNALDYDLTVRTVDFDAQLTWLQAQGYHSITQTELFDALYYGKVLPQHPMILSFDDGYEDMYTDALPALLAHHYRGVFYIITGMIGGRYMTWPQIQTLARDGMQIASHTVHHVNVGAPPYGTSTQAELLDSKATLQQALGVPIQFFCYPSGEPFHHDTLWEQNVVLTDLFNDGYVSATLDPFSLNSAVQNAQLPYQLTRIRVSGGESLDAFIGILNFTLRWGAYQLG
jgi:peptidoglycan/xylan/chitin deacetylase (PgdA/CDA1 family)